MITFEEIMAIPKEELQQAAQALEKDSIPQLVEWLTLKDDSIRYQAFLLLQNRSMLFDDVYPYWSIFQSKLKSDNSYQRSLGLMLMAENVIWDTESRMEETIDEYLNLLDDEKPITVRQCIQSLGKIAAAKPGLQQKIASRLISLDLMQVKESMRKLILLDILNVLLFIRKEKTSDALEGYILNALSGELLDKKTKKQIGALVGLSV